MKELSLTILFVVTFTVVGYFVIWIIVRITDNNTNRMLNITYKIYSIIVPVSCFVWILESIRMKSWFNKELTTGIFIVNLIIIVLLWIFKISFKKIEGKRAYFERQKYIKVTYIEQRRNMLFLLFMVAIPALNVISIIYFIRSNV